MDSSRRTRRRFLAAAGAAVVGTVAGCSSEPTGENSGDRATTRDDSQATTREIEAGSSPYARVYQETIDSVVLVRVFTSLGTTGQGSGFVFGDGHVVTNQHVVEGADHVEVRFADGTWEKPELLGTDVYADLAALSVPDRPDAATPLELVESDPPVGAEVVALGNPFGFGESVSAGIVSGVDRSLSGPNDFAIPDAVQTDAAVNPGNSGGPLVTLDGDVVGVINSGGGDNLGFAISAAMVRRVVPALVEDGRYEHSYMGVRLLTVTPSVAEANDLDAADGVLIVEVVDGGPSDGVLEGSTGEATVHNREVPVGGDVVRRMGDRRIRTQEDLANVLALETRPGDTIPVEVLRDGERVSVELTLGTRPDPP